MSNQEFKMSPIGYVRAGEAGFRLQVEKEYRPALNGLEGFSHINVFWWCHLLDNEEQRKIMECEQPYKTAPAKLGIFATRSPLRPNPIALTPVFVARLDCAQGVIHTPYIDAEDGTPILDLKPYHPAVDRIREVAVPDWCRHWPQWLEDSASFDWAAEFVNAR